VTSRSLTSFPVAVHAECRRRDRRGPRHGALTVSRWLARIGLGKRSRLTPPEPPNRYERARPGELIHVDVKKLGRILRPGHRVTGNRRDRFTDARGYGVAGWEFVHVCVDDATRLAFVKVLADERGETAAGFLRRAVEWFGSMGVTVERVMSDNGSCYRSHVHASACRELGIRHLRTQPYRPRTNGKAERFIPDDHQPLVLRSHLRQLSRADRGATRLADPLQLHSTTRLPWPQGTRHSARRVGTTS
jgi:transposase InsO family protein